MTSNSQLTYQHNKDFLLNLVRDLKLNKTTYRKGQKITAHFWTPINFCSISNFSNSIQYPDFLSSKLSPKHLLLSSLRHHKPPNNFPSRSSIAVSQKEIRSFCVISRLVFSSNIRSFVVRFAKTTKKRGEKVLVGYGGKLKRLGFVGEFFLLNLGFLVCCKLDFFNSTFFISGVF